MGNGVLLLYLRLAHDAWQAVASRHLLHIGVDMVINLCHGKTRQFMLVLADVILLFALVLFTISGWNYTVAQIPHLGTTIKVSLALF